MRHHRRWTLMLVPDGCDSARSFSVNEKTLRRIAAALSTVGLLALLGAGVGIARLSWGRSGAPDRRTAQAADPALRDRLEALSDTIEAITHRDEQIRLLAGLPADSADSSGAMLAGLGGDGASVTQVSEPQPADLDRLIRRANVLAASFSEVSDTLASNADRYSHIPSIMPTAGWLSSAFSRSRFHPILHISRPHEGIDVSAPMGAPIVAPAAGVVTLVTRENGYGNVLEIDHGGGIVTKYAHCSRIVVHQGQHVQRGQVIANVGSTGLSTGPHLHYEIHVHGKVVDPLTYVLPSGAIPD